MEGALRLSTTYGREEIQALRTCLGSWWHREETRYSKAMQSYGPTCGRISSRDSMHLVERGNTIPRQPHSWAVIRLIHLNISTVRGLCGLNEKCVSQGIDYHAGQHYICDWGNSRLPCRHPICSVSVCPSTRCISQAGWNDIAVVGAFSLVEQVERLSCP